MLTRAEIEINAKTIRNYLETLGTGNFSSAGGRLGGFGWVTIKFKGFPSKALKYSAIKIDEDWSQTYIYFKTCGISQENSNRKLNNLSISLF